MRKTFLVLIGAAAGAALTLVAVQPPHYVRRHEREGGRLVGHLPQPAICSVTYSSASAPTMSRSRKTQSWSKRAINGMLAGLDPHSSYMDGKSFRDMQIQTRAVNSAVLASK